MDPVDFADEFWDLHEETYKSETSEDEAERVKRLFKQYINDKDDLRDLKDLKDSSLDESSVRRILNHEKCRLSKKEKGAIEKDLRKTIEEKRQLDAYKEAMDNIQKY